MSKKTIAYIVAGILLTSGILFTLMGFLMHGNFTTVNIDSEGVHVEQIGMNRSGNDEQVKEKGDVNMTKEFENFKNIDVSAISARIELIKSDKNKIEYNLHYCEKVDNFEVIGDTLTFKTHAIPSISIFSFSDYYVKVYYKDDLNIENVSLSTISGSVIAGDVRGKAFNASSTSGSIKINNIEAGEITAGNISGSITADKIAGETVKINSNSGSVTMDGVNCTAITIKNTSGSIKLRNAVTGSSKINENSGSILMLGEFKGKNIISNVSGSITIHTSLPESEYGYKLNSLSGTTKVDDSTFKGTVREGKENFIDASNLSGSVRVYFNSKGE